MKKTIGLVMVLALLVSLVLVGAAIAGNNGKKADKVGICHFADHAGDWILALDDRFCPNFGGTILSVNGNALRGHGLSLP